MFINSIHIQLFLICRIHSFFSHHHLSPFQRVVRTSKRVPRNRISIPNIRLVYCVQICFEAFIVPPSPMSLLSTVIACSIIILVLCCKLHIVVVSQWITCNKTKKLKNTTLSDQFQYFDLIDIATWIDFVTVSLCFYTSTNNHCFRKPWTSHRGLGLWCLTPLSTIFQLYRGGIPHR